MDLLIRAADMGEQDKTLGEWLALVPDKARTRGMEIVLARRALRRGQAADARSAHRRLIEAGRADADVLLWAGHLAEDARDYAQAETLYDQARKHKGASAALATLYLARLHLRRGRHQRAGQLLRAHLDAHVDDATARALLAVVDAAGKPAR